MCLPVQSPPGLPFVYGSAQETHNVGEPLRPKPPPPPDTTVCSIGAACTLLESHDSVASLSFCAAASCLTIASRSGVPPSDGCVPAKLARVAKRLMNTARAAI